MERWQMWLKWTVGNLHKASNRTTFFYLVWTPLVVFYSAIAFMGMPVAVACPKENGVCHNLRVLAVKLNYCRRFYGISLPKSKMEIFAFLIGLGCLVLLVWAMAAPAVLGIAFFSKLIADHQDRRLNRRKGDLRPHHQNLRNRYNLIFLL